jgi:hypothetical protein
MNFSVMHHSIREVLPDYARARLGIIQLDVLTDGTRRAVITYDEGFDLFSFDEVQAMVSDTVRVWSEICEGRVEEARRYADDGEETPETPPLFKLWRAKA